MEEQVETLLNEYNRYKGFWGAILLAISGIGAAFTLFLEYFKGN